MIPPSRKLNFAQRNRLRKLLLRTVPDYLVAQLGSNQCCMSASWLVAQLLNAYGIACRARRVSVMFTNKRGVALRKKFFRKMQQIRDSGKTLTEDQEKTLFHSFFQRLKTDPQVWIVRLAVQQDDEMVDDHAVIEFADGSILDMTADQASRPEKHLVGRRFWVPKGKLPSFVFYFEFADTPMRQGSVVDHPKFAEIIQFISKQVASIVAIKPLNVTIIKTQKAKPDE